MSQDTPGQEIDTLSATILRLDVMLQSSPRVLERTVSVSPWPLRNKQNGNDW